MNVHPIVILHVLHPVVILETRAPNKCYRRNKLHGALVVAVLGRHVHPINVHSPVVQVCLCPNIR